MPGATARSLHFVVDCLARPHTDYKAKQLVEVQCVWIETDYRALKVSGFACNPTHGRISLGEACLFCQVCLSTLQLWAIGLHAAHVRLCPQHKHTLPHWQLQCVHHFKLLGRSHRALFQG